MKKTNILFGLIPAIILFIWIWPTTATLLVDIVRPQRWTSEYIDEEPYRYTKMVCRNKQLGDRVTPIPVDIFLVIVFNAMPLVSLIVVPVLCEGVDGATKFIQKL